ncbi:EpsG family protein [Salinicoccus roseus]|uniref:EpsG family protein n=1 Tax=Salinicoccus roseus TaxID=45670 RepID=UPI000FC31714|nr:EpsG family protein [Salinicoccus roseus]RPE54767.1 EpsG-like putative glucosyltransferase [Salinicoccus roseus]GGA62758.1 hypothetical protein GCM10007176_04040 [Salinicoccus roseus]
MVTSFLLYFSIFLITAISAELSIRFKGKILRFTFAFLTLLTPSLFAGIRYDVGTDYFSYLRIFSNLEAGNPVRTEFGFNFLNVLIAKLGGDVHFLFFIVSFLTMAFIYLTLYKNRNSISIGLGIFVFLLFFYHDSLNGVRQGLAIAISLYSLTFIVEKKFWKFFLYTILATSMHFSSLVLLPFYYIYNVLGDKNRIFRIAVYLITVVLIFNYGVILDFLLNIFTDFSYYSKYLPDQSVGGLGLGLIAFNAPLIIPGILFYKRLVKNDERFRFYFFFLLVGVLIKFVGYFGADHLNRVADPFFIAVVLIVPYYYKYLKKNEIEYFLGMLIILFIISLWFYNYIFLGQNETIPFRTIFSQ